jgi:hypothetical protein
MDAEALARMLSVRFRSINDRVPSLRHQALASGRRMSVA